MAKTPQELREEARSMIHQDAMSLAGDKGNEIKQKRNAVEDHNFDLKKTLEMMDHGAGHTTDRPDVMPPHVLGGLVSAKIDEVRKTTQVGIQNLSQQASKSENSIEDKMEKKSNVSRSKTNAVEFVDKENRSTRALPDISGIVDGADKGSQFGE